MDDPARLPPLLLPSPRRCRPLPGPGAWAPELVGRDGGLPAEGFRLRVAADGVRIDHRDEAGLRHARACLAQLKAQYGEQAPGVDIEDEPAFAVRGVMLDISRDRIPTLDELLALIATLASWRCNHLELYCEHAIAYAGHEDVWRGLDPYTPAELRRIQAACQAAGIRLGANQNCFGHLERFLRLPRYRPLAEIQEGDRWRFGQLDWRTAPHSLCPADPASLALVRDLLDQQLAILGSDTVNIGCDETYDVGFGRSRDAVAARGRAAVYTGFVAQVCGEVARHGRRPAFWADIALEHPECLAELPDDLIALAWGYEPDAPFARWLGQLGGRETWVCPGTSCWLSHCGRSGERRDNLLNAAEQGREGGARGYLVTSWGDHGHRQPWPATLHALAEGLHRAWSGSAPFAPEASSLHAFHDRSLAVGHWLDRLGGIDAALRAVGGKADEAGRPSRLRNRSALWHDLHLPWAQDWIGDAETWEDLVGELWGLHEIPLGEGLVADELSYAWELSHAAAERGWHRREPRLAHLRSDDARRLRAIKDQHAGLWLRRARRGGLADSQAHWDRLIADLEQA